MISPRTAVLVAAACAATLATTACGVAPDAGLVASVEGAELSVDEFDDLVRELAGDDVAEIDGDTARQIVGTFVGSEVLRADLAAMGVEPLEIESEATGVEALQNDFQLLVSSWSSLPTATTLDSEVAERYAAGPEAAGVACAAHILVATEAEANSVTDRLTGGEAFADVAAEVSIDTGSAANGGSLGCLPTERFERQFIAEFVEAALAAEVGVSTEPVESEFGWHVIELVPIDRISPQDALVVRLATFAERFDIVIDPRFGQWDANSIIVPVT